VVRKLLEGLSALEAFYWYMRRGSMRGAVLMPHIIHELLI
jgi:hypothetical protein